MARHGEARQGMEIGVGPGMVRRGIAGKGKARQGNRGVARPGRARLGVARRGMAGYGNRGAAWQGKARSGAAGLGRENRGMAGLGAAGHGTARQGMNKGNDVYGGQYPSARKEAIARSGGTCQFCGQAPVNEAHHWADLEYPPGAEVTGDDLTALCINCHDIATSYRRFTRAGGDRWKFKHIFKNAMKEAID